MKSRYDSTEVMMLLGISKVAVHKKAKKKGWDFVWKNNPAGGGKLKVYMSKSFDEKTQIKIFLKENLTSEKFEIKNKANTEQLAKTDEKENLPCLLELKGWQRKTMDARICLYRVFEQLEELHGTNKAIEKFIALVKTETLPEHLLKLVPVANARSGGKNGKRTISRATIMRWKRWDRQGNPVAFAPKSIEKNKIPVWADYFLKCYQVPQNICMTEAMEEMEKILPPDIPMPSYDQVRRFNNKRSRLDRERGRRTGSAFKSIKRYRQRDTSQLLPTDVYLCDGHSFKAKVSHPTHGRPFKPEVCAVIDAATRVVVGWSAGVAESAITVADALRHAVTINDDKKYGGIPAILYTDGGSGNIAKVNSDKIVGLFPRLGITAEKGLPGNAQGHGLMEIVNKSMWIKAAKKLLTFCGKGMDAATQRRVYLTVNKDIKHKGTSDSLISWPAFLKLCQEAVDDYNRRPHRALPKITDQQTGRKRHMSPFEQWAMFVAKGWQPEEPLSQDELTVLFRPRQKVHVKRGYIKLWTNSYSHKALEHYHDERLIAAYDIHDSSLIQVWDTEDRFICHAKVDSNKSDYFPMSKVEHAGKERAKRRSKIAYDNLDEIEAELQGVLDIKGVQVQEVIEASALSSQTTIDREELQKEMEMEPEWEVPMDDAAKYRAWCDLDQQLHHGEAITDKQARFYRAFQKSETYAAFKMVNEDLAPAVNQ